MMTRFIFKLPDIGEGIAAAEIVAWHVAPGEVIAEDQPLADLMTDKATVEIESPVAGTVQDLAGAVGDTIAIGAPLVTFDIADSGSENRMLGEPPTPGGSEAADVLPPPCQAGQTGRVQDDLSISVDAATTAPSPQKILASPAVRARARDLGIDLSTVEAEGRHVRHADLDAFLRYRTGEGYLPPHASRRWEDRSVRVVGLRRRIAENMTAAKRSIPHFTYVEEIDVTALETSRMQLNATRGERPRLTILPLLIAATCRALPRYPMLNARYDDEAGLVSRSGRVHLGIATQTDAGLLVPVLRDAQDLNLWQLAGEIARLAASARDGTIRSADLNGSTLTVTSLGALGGVATTPVINRPEVAIIAPNRVVERPAFVQDTLGQERIGRAKLMNLSISCDHRVVDGWDAASFVRELKTLLENPVQLLCL